MNSGNAFPDLTRIRIEYRIKMAETAMERELAESLLFMYDRGEIEVSNDILTGELLFKPAYVN